MNKKVSEEKRNTVSEFFKKLLVKEDTAEAGEVFQEPKKDANGKSGTARRLLSGALYPFVSALFSFAVSTASPALGTLPIGPALLSAAPSLTTALPILIGALAASVRLGKGSVPFLFVSIGIFSVRLALGALGTVQVNPVDAKYFSAQKKIKEPWDSLNFIKINSAFNTAHSIRVAVSLAAAVVLGIANILSGTNLWYDVFGTVLGVSLTTVLCYAYSSFFDPDSNPVLRKAGAGALLFALVLSVSGVSIGGIRIAIVIALFASMSAGRSLGVADGALIGTFAGLGLDPGSFAVFPIAAMCSGALGAYSAGIAAVASAILGMSWALFSKGISAVSSTLPEVLLGAALYYPAARLGVIPDEISIFEKREGHTALSVGKERSVSEKIKKLSSAMENMSRVFSNLSSRLKFPDSTETFDICEAAFMSHCDICSKRDICHTRESFKTGGVVRGAARSLAENGKVTVSSFPPTMMRACPSIDDISAEINRSYRRLIEDGVRGDKTSVIASDYANIAQMISECVTEAEEESERNDKLSSRLEERMTAEGITYESLSVYGKLRPQVCIRGFTVKDLTCGAQDLKKMAEEAVDHPLTDPEMSIDYDKLNLYCECRKRFSALFGQYSAEGHENESNGDVIRSFRGGDNFYLVICDGMGSGREAALTAKVSALFLERMLGAGCTERAALKLLNDFTKERKIECFSTVDLLKIDPFSGEAVFFKSGAAPSFVFRDGRLFRIECETTPVGILDRVSAKTVNFKLKAGDHIVMLSDGILPDYDNSAWLYELLSDRKTFDPCLPNAAKNIADAGRRHALRPDDATVGVVRIDKAS